MSGRRDELQLNFSNIHVDTYGNKPNAIEIHPKLNLKGLQVPSEELVDYEAG